jgi:hypothetical protein
MPYFVEVTRVCISSDGWPLEKELQTDVGPFETTAKAENFLIVSGATGATVVTHGRIAFRAPQESETLPG